jgi:hypothetical protein
MAADAVPASSSRTTLSEAWWFRLAIRTILGLLALWALYFADRRYDVFHNAYLNWFRMDVWLWLSWIGLAVAAGVLFGLAAWLPFTRVRYLWSRLLLAALAFVPLAHFWLVWGYLLPRRHELSGWLVTSWFWGYATQSVLAALGGVAIASGFRAKGSEPVVPSG